MNDANGALTRQIRFQVAGARMVPIRSVTGAASALVLGKAVAKRPLTGIVNDSTNPGAQPILQADVASALVEGVLARCRASDGPNFY